MNLDEAALTLVANAWWKRFPQKQLRVPALSHYTSAEGLLGICTSNALWATCARYSNDVSEFVYAHSIAVDVVKQTLASRTLTSSGEQFKSQLVSTLSTLNFGQDAYIVSFCESSDLLSQWRAYGKSAGFEIRFGSLTAANPLLQADVLILGSPAVYRKMLRKVQYNIDVQRAMFVDVLERALAVVVDVESEPRTGLEDMVSVVLAFALLELSEVLYCIKHPSFEEEQEWRIISFPTMLRFLHGGEYAHSELVKLRPGRHSLVPYIELLPSDAKLPISEIVCGPGGHETLTCKSVQLLLASKGFKNTKIRNSNVPLAQ